MQTRIKLQYTLQNANSAKLLQNLLTFSATPSAVQSTKLSRCLLIYIKISVYLFGKISYFDTYGRDKNGDYLQ